MRKVAAVAALLLLGACGAPPTTPAAVSPVIACASGSVAGQGSSAQASAVNAWIKDYQVACPSASLAYASTGSGTGVRAFLSGAKDFAGTDSVLSEGDQRAAAARCGGAVVHLPMVVGPIALAYNVAGVAGLRLSAGALARIFDGRISAWNDPVIARDNPGVVLPGTRIRAVHRADDSGTTDNFTKFLASSGDWAFGSGAAWTAPGGVAAKGSNRVVATVERTDGAIGYVEASYARFNNLPVAAVGVGSGSFAELSDAAAGEAVAGARVSGAGSDVRLSLDYRAGGYPVVLVTYEVVCASGAPELVKSFLGYAVGPAGQAAASRLGYAPLPPELRERVADAVAGLR